MIDSIPNGLNETEIAENVSVTTDLLQKKIKVHVKSPEYSNMEIVLYNALGQIREFSSGKSMLNNDYTIDASNLSTGVYYIMVKTEGNIFSKKVILI